MAVVTLLPRLPMANTAPEATVTFVPAGIAVPRPSIKRGAVAAPHRPGVHGGAAGVTVRRIRQDQRPGAVHVEPADDLVAARRGERTADLSGPAATDNHSTEARRSDHGVRADRQRRAR